MMRVDYSEKDMLLKVYPTVSGCFSEAWDVLKRFFLPLLLAVLVAGLVDAPIGYKQYMWENEDSFLFGMSFATFFSFLYYLLIATPFNYGVDRFFLKSVRNKESRFEEVLSGFKKYLPVVFCQLLVIVLVGFGFLLLIIPGIYLLCKLIFVPYLILDKKLDPIQAIKLSFYLSKGYFWTIFGMGLLSFLIIILGLLCFIVGIFVSLVWINTAFAVLYKAVEELHFKEACELAGIRYEEADQPEFTD